MIHLAVQSRVATCAHLNIAAPLLPTQPLLLISCLSPDFCGRPKTKYSSSTSQDTQFSSDNPHRSTQETNCQQCSYNWMFMLSTGFWSWSPYMKIQGFWGVMLCHWVFPDISKHYSVLTFRVRLPIKSSRVEKQGVDFLLETIDETSRSARPEQVKMGPKSMLARWW